MIFIVNCETCVKFNTKCCPYPLHAKDGSKKEHEACESYSFDGNEDNES